MFVGMDIALGMNHGGNSAVWIRPRRRIIGASANTGVTVYGTLRIKVQRLDTFIDMSISLRVNDDRIVCV